MDAWATFWGLLLIVVLVIFAGLTVVIAIGGFFDLKSLFKSIDEQHHDNESLSREDKHDDG